MDDNENEDDEDNFVPDKASLTSSIKSQEQSEVESDITVGDSSLSSFESDSSQMSDEN